MPLPFSRQSLLIPTLLLGLSLAGCAETTRTGSAPTAQPTSQARATRVAATDRTSTGPASDVVEEARVVEVVDGDTIRVDLGGRQELVRMTGIDTPEVGGPYRDPECYGAEASALAKQLVPPGSTVALERDVSERDRYGRLLRSVWTFTPVDGWTLVNEALVRRGAAEARAYEPDVTYGDRLDAAESLARAEGVGMWSRCGAGTGLSPGEEVRAALAAVTGPLRWSFDPGSIA